VDMWWLIGLVAIEIEPIRAHCKSGRHARIVPNCSGHRIGID
jgi:hypothetical protein